MKKSVVVYVLFMFFGLVVAEAADIEKMALTARSRGGDVIKCSPNGRDGTKTLQEGLKQLKEGMVLHLLPGDYEEAPLESSLDNITIEGDPQGFCAVDIKLRGKNVVIRNYWGSYVCLRGDSTIVDSVIGLFKTSWDNNKAQYYLYNCCLHSVFLGDYNHKVYLKNCTFVQNSKDSYCISMWHGGYISIQDSILYSESRCFLLDGRPNVQVENSILYGALSLAVDDTSSSRDRGTEANDVKTLKKICKMKTKGEIIIEKPVFVVQSTFEEASRNFSGGGVSWCRERHDKDLNVFKLDKDSPGKEKGYGANLDENGFPVAKNK